VLAALPFLGDLFEAPGVKETVQSFLHPDYVPYYLIAISVITALARLRTLNKRAERTNRQGLRRYHCASQVFYIRGSEAHNRRCVSPATAVPPMIIVPQAVIIPPMVIVALPAHIRGVAAHAIGGVINKPTAGRVDVRDHRVGFRRDHRWRCIFVVGDRGRRRVAISCRRCVVALTHGRVHTIAWSALIIVGRRSLQLRSGHRHVGRRR
jgi:hypothetical protein